MSSNLRFSAPMNRPLKTINHHVTSDMIKRRNTTRMKKGGKITYIKGDATDPGRCSDPDIEREIMIIFHICNDINRWGKGFVTFVSDRWPLSKEIYHAGSKKLGTVSIGEVDKNLYVANMIAQHDIRWIDGVPPIRYDALRECLVELSRWAGTLKKDGTVISFHGPYMGAGYAGGDWNIIEGIIEENLRDFPVYIYKLE